MKKSIAALLLPLLVIGFTGLISCKDKAAKKEQIGNEKKKVEYIEKEIEKNVYPLPTSAEVIKMLTDLEVGFMHGIAIPTDNATKYYTSATRSLNLGGFGADLSYCTLYNIEQEVINYMDAIRKLCNDLNMSTIYNAALYDSIKKNFDNKDALVRILTKSFNDTYSYLSENDQQDLALLVVGGAWLEGMYLTTHVSEAAYQVPQISGVLLKQKASFEIFLDLTKPYLENLIIKDFVNSLDPIKNVYKGLTTSLTMQNIKDITEAITSVRNKMIQ